MELLIAGLAIFVGFAFGVYTAGISLHIVGNMFMTPIAPQTYAFVQAVGGLICMFILVRLVVWYLIPYLYEIYKNKEK